ncbi:hypothetical protein [Actinoplanes sp. NPDC051851]|uniref:hypothetical protein n=1 Tax=Actinoplanes sp. NPDC051851 TaxID=3154753 RepID=UPI00341A26C3
MSILGARRSRGDGTLFARATPSKVTLTEIYSVEQDISKNKSLRQAGDGTGRIEILVPYDGREFFSRLAVADVQQGLGAQQGMTGDRRATIGHLLISDHTRTTGLLPSLRLHGTAGALPLTVPIATADGTLDLTGDRKACSIAYDYQPANPSLNPIELDVGLDDPDSLSHAFETVLDSVTRKREEPSKIIERLRQQASFDSELLLRITVKISIPIKYATAKPKPVVKHMSIAWPALTSLRSTQLYVAEPGPDAGGPSIREAPIRYNPAKDRGRLEWQDVPVPQVAMEGEQTRGNLRSYHEVSLFLKIGHPGELFQQRELAVEAQVDITGYLLSGLDVRPYDATGQRQVRRPEVTTKLRVHATIYPDDIFATRRFSPYQQFVFDDVIPDEQRITDILTVLNNAGFKAEKVPAPGPPAPPDPVTPSWLLQATRSHGPDELFLLVAVEGRRTRLDREQILGDRVRIRDDKESGQLKVSVLGTLPVNHRELTREMNALQLTLRERFRFQQTSRK